MHIWSDIDFSSQGTAAVAFGELIHFSSQGDGQQQFVRVVHIVQGDIFKIEALKEDTDSSISLLVPRGREDLENAQQIVPH